MGKFLNSYLTLYIPSFPYDAEIIAAVAAVFGFCLLNYAAGIRLILWFDGLVGALFFMLRSIKFFFGSIKKMFRKIRMIRLTPSPKQEKKEPVFTMSDMEKNEDNIVPIIKEPKIKTTIEEKTKSSLKNKNTKKTNFIAQRGALVYNRE